MKLKIIYLCIWYSLSVFVCVAQNILPTPMQVKLTDSKFVFKKQLKVAYSSENKESAYYLAEKLKKYIQIKLVESNSGDIILNNKLKQNNLGREGYELSIKKNRIEIRSNTSAGSFYGIQSLLQLLPYQVQSQKNFHLVGTRINGLEVVDKPKYQWRSFMLDSGRQYQSLEFIKRYLDHIAMLKMNVFHWHLTEGQGWRIEIKKYPKLTEIGSQVAHSKEQKGYYSQQEIKDIVDYAKRLHITVVPEIDVPGHSEAALIAYPEMTCFKETPKSVMEFTPYLFCGGREETYEFIQGILDEVCELFPSEYIHLGGDEAPKDHWNKCTDCQNKIRHENLQNTHNLQLYFSSRLTKYLKTKGKKVIFWGDVVYNEGYSLPDNVIIHWWNWRGHKDLALKNAIKRGHQVICNTNYYSYLNFPLTAWSKYNDDRTFDMRMVYDHNPSDLRDSHELVIGMGTCLWTDWYVQEYMIDRRVFPRIFALSEQMWSCSERLPFEQFYDKVQEKYPLLNSLGIDYGPALKEEVPANYQWD